MGGQQSHEVQSFRTPVKTHIQGLFTLVDAMKTQDTEMQSQAVELLRKNVDQWIAKLNKLVVGAGSLLTYPFNESVKDEVKLAFGILNCKCGLGKYGTCENGQLTRDAFHEVQKNHNKIVRAMTMLLGHEEEWTHLLAKQLATMDKYFTNIADEASVEEIAKSEADCYEAGEELITALDMYVLDSGNSGKHRS